VIVSAFVGASTVYILLNYKFKYKEESQDNDKIVRSQRDSLIYEQPPGETAGILFPYNHEEKMRRRIAARVAVEEDNMTPRNSVTVRVPATSANVGPGCK